MIRSGPEDLRTEDTEHRTQNTREKKKKKKKKNSSGDRSDSQTTV